MADDFKYTAVNPTTGRRIGSNDGKNWVPIIESAPTRYIRSLRSGLGMRPEGGVKEDISDLFSGLKQIGTHPIESGKLLLGAVSEAQQSVIDKAYEEQHSPNPMVRARGFIRGIYASLPGAGPLMSQAGEQFGRGDIAGALGTMTPLLAERPIRAIGERLPSSLRSISEVPERARTTLQQAVVGRAEVERARITHEAEVKAANEAFEKKVAEVGQKTAADEAAHRLAIEQSKDKYAKAVAEYRERAREASARESAAAVKKQAFTQPRSGPVYQRLSGWVDRIATEYVPRLDRDVRSVYNARWGAWRQAMGDAEGNFTPVQQAVMDAEGDILKGSPENIAIFRNILREGEDPLLAEASVFRGGRGGALDVKEVLGSRFMSGAARERILQQLETEGAEPPFSPSLKGDVTLPIDDIRGYVTELQEKMYTGQVAGDVRRALKYVADAANKEVKRVAKEKGQLSIYNRLSSDWSQYMTDFYDRDGALTKLKNATNSDSRLNLLAGSEGANIVDALGRYVRSSPAVSQSAVGLIGRVRSVMKSLREMPSAAKLPEPPERPAFPPAKPPRPMPERPETGPFSPERYRREHIQRTAENLSRITGWDVASIGYALRELFTGEAPWALGYPVGKRLLSRLLSNPRVIEYLAREGGKQ